ncbi:MAG: YceD family protein [Campylobacterota bacterium]
MLIPFRRLGAVPVDFELNRDNARFSGEIFLKKSNLAQLNGTITGSISIPCDICAEPIETPLNEEVSFYLSDGIYKGNEEEFDVVEIDTATIDMDELFRSEIELIRSDYYCCSNCEGKTLDAEF